MEPPRQRSWQNNKTEIGTPRSGGADRDRTDDLKLAKLALSQLSYGPVSSAGLPTEAAIAAKVGGARRDRTDDLLLAKQALSQLSYTPDKKWWVWLDLNQRPHAYQACALTN